MLVRAVGKPDRRAHQELDAQALDVVLHPGKVLHAQEGQPMVARVCARVLHVRAPLQVTYQLQHAAEAEGDAVLQAAYRLRAEDFRVPAGGLFQIAARHGDVGDVAPHGDRGIVEQRFGLEQIRGRAHGDQSTLILASRTTSAHRRSSPFTTLSSSSGVEPTTSPPCSSSFCLTSGSWMVRAISFCIRDTIAGGVFAGANSAYQESTS